MSSNKNKTSAERNLDEGVQMQKRAKTFFKKLKGRYTNFFPQLKSLNIFNFQFD